MPVQQGNLAERIARLHDVEKHLLAIRRFAGTQNRRHAVTGLRVIYMDGKKAPFIVMSVEERHLLMAMHRVRGIIDIQRDGLGRPLVAFAPQLHHAP